MTTIAATGSQKIPQQFPKSERRDPWERQPRESAPAFAAFRAYRDMGEGRSLTRAAEEVGKSRDLLRRWSRRWSWVFRAEAWDREEERLVRQATVKARREMSERHAKIAVAVQQKVVTRLAQIDPSELTPSDLIRWLEVSVKIERAARGEPERVEVSGANGGAVQVEVAQLSDEQRRLRMEQLRDELDARLRTA